MKFSLKKKHYEAYTKLKADNYFLESKQANTFKLQKKTYTIV